MIGHLLAASSVSVSPFSTNSSLLSLGNPLLFYNHPRDLGGNDSKPASGVDSGWLKPMASPALALATALGWAYEPVNEVPGVGRGDGSGMLQSSHQDREGMETPEAAPRM